MQWYTTTPLRGPLQAVGQRPPPPAARGREAATSLLNELTARFPMCETAIGGLSSVTISGTVPLGQSAWYSLINFSPQVEIGQEVVLFGGYVEQLSCNPTPTTPASQAAWGDEYGNGAAIVVGEDLPIGDAGTWSAAQCPVAGVEADIASVTNSRGRVLWSRGFPPGKLTVGWNRRALNMAVVPFVKRITTGRRLCAALLLNRAQANAGAGKTLNALVHVELYYGFTKNTVDLAQ